MASFLSPIHRRIGLSNLVTSEGRFGQPVFQNFQNRIGRNARIRLHLDFSRPSVIQAYRFYVLDLNLE
ncbi:MAG: hypothetical protein ACPGLY_04085 [Rubripirellula sp.]